MKDDTFTHFDESDGTRFWFDDKMRLHREDGPAVIYVDGREEYYFEDVRIEAEIPILEL